MTDQHPLPTLLVFEPSDRFPVCFAQRIPLLFSIAKPAFSLTRHAELCHFISSLIASSTWKTCSFAFLKYTQRWQQGPRLSQPIVRVAPGHALTHGCGISLLLLGPGPGPPRPRLLQSATSVRVSVLGECGSLGCVIGGGEAVVRSHCHIQLSYWARQSHNKERRTKKFHAARATGDATQDGGHQWCFYGNMLKRSV